MQAYKMMPKDDFHKSLLATNGAICNIMQDHTAGYGQISSLVPTLLTGSTIVRLGGSDGADDVLMAPEEHFEVQGWPVFTSSEDQPSTFLDVMKDFSTCEKKSLMGNSMHVSLCGVLLLYAISNFESVHVLEDKEDMIRTPTLADDAHLHADIGKADSHSLVDDDEEDGFEKLAQDVCAETATQGKRASGGGEQAQSEPWSKRLRNEFDFDMEEIRLRNAFDDPNTESDEGEVCDSDSILIIDDNCDT
jgi:hypothetical protein